MLHNPKILILDEATASLDTETEKNIQDALQKLTERRTTIAIAHRLSTLRNATKLVVLDKGKVAEIGTHNELLEKKGIYYNLVMAQRQMSKNELKGKFMLRIGCHLSSSAGYLEMGKTAAKIGAGTFAFFTRNPRGGAAKAIDEGDIAAFLAFAEEHDIKNLVAHAPYTLNPCSSTEATRIFAENTMRDDLKRMEYTPGNYYNFHPGSHTGQGTETGIAQISDMLNKILTDTQTTTVLLETMAGKGSEVGGRFEELREIIDRVEKSGKLGVCLDTCHIYDGGYDIVGNPDGVLAEFDRVIGLSRLKAVHLNDSIYGFLSHKDRHAKIGEGKIGTEALARIINHPALQGLPFILETPNELDGYAAEISLLKSLYTGE